jgi:putative hydrolase of the HAD superfamily
MRPGIKSILFDFGGTLDADGTTWLDRFYPLYKEAGVVADKKAFAAAFYHSDDSLPERFSLKGLSLEQTIERQVDTVLEELAPQKRASGKKIAERFLTDCRTSFHRNRPLLERLGKRFKLGIVSNFYGNLEGILISEGLRELFGSVADSGVLGVTKPEPGLFLHAIKELRSSPEESIMVGDSIPRDMRGAEIMGMAHALISPSATRCCEAALVVATLLDLEPILSPERVLR